MRAAVVGAGIAGLTAAADLVRAGVDVVVYEASDAIGGKLRTGRIGDLSLDVGAESMLARRPEGLDLAARAGRADDIVHPEPGPATLWTRGALRPIPPTVMGVPTDLTALESSGVLTRPPVSTSIPVPDDDVSIGRFVGDRLGREVVDQLVEPLLGGVYAGRADHLSLRATAPMLTQLGPDLLAGAKARPATATGAGPMLAGLRGGMGTLAASVVEAAGLEVRTGHTVRGLERDGSGWLLVVGPTTATVRESFDAVVIAAPAPATSRLLAAVAPESSFALAGVEYASMALVTLVLRGAELPGGNGFLVPPTEGTTIKAATFFSAKWAWVHESAPDVQVVRMSVGRAGDTAALRHDDATLVDLAAADLRSVVEPTNTIGVIATAGVQRWGGALPQYDVGHLDVVQRVEREIAGIDGLALCGAAYHGVGVPAVVATGHDAARKIVSHE